MKKDDDFNFYEFTGAQDLDFDGDIDAEDSALEDDFALEHENANNFDDEIWDDVNDRFVSIDELSDEELEYYHQTGEFMPIDKEVVWDPSNMRYVNLNELTDEEFEYYQQHNDFMPVGGDTPQIYSDAEIYESYQINNLVDLLVKDFPELKSYEGDFYSSFFEVIEQNYQYDKNQTLKYIEWAVKFKNKHLLNENTRRELLIDSLLAVFIASEYSDKYLYNYFKKNYCIFDSVFDDVIWNYESLDLLNYCLKFFEKNEDFDFARKIYNHFYKTQKIHFSDRDISKFWFDHIDEDDDVLKNVECYEFFKDAILKLKNNTESVLKKLEKLNLKYRTADNLPAINCLSDFDDALLWRFPEIKEKYGDIIGCHLIEDALMYVYEENKRDAIKYFEWLCLNYNENNINVSKEEKVQYVTSIKKNVVLNLITNFNEDEYLYNYLKSNKKILFDIFEGRLVKWYNDEYQNFAEIVAFFVNFSDEKLAIECYRSLKNNQQLGSLFYLKFWKTYIEFFMNKNDYFKDFMISELKLIDDNRAIKILKMLDQE